MFDAHAHHFRIPTPWTLVLGFAALWLTLPGCEAMKSRDEGGGATVEACTVAQACCAELEQAGAYGEVGDRAGKRNAWPNHCPSWDVRQTSECRELLDAVTAQRDQIEDDHPVFEMAECEP